MVPADSLKNRIVSISRRIFGQSHLSVFVDGMLRLTVNVRIPPVGEVKIFVVV